MTNIYNCFYNSFLAKSSPFAFAIILLLACDTDKTPDVRELHQKYMTASINHDIETLSAMTHEDIVWQLGRYTLKGKEAALGPNRYDAGTGAIIEYSNVVVRGDTVEFDFFERNEMLSDIGLEGVRHYPRFIFKDGLVIRKEPWKKSPDMPEMNRRLQPKRDWLKEKHPEVVQKFFDSDGNFIFSRENGELAVQMTREWRKATQAAKAPRK